MAFKWSVGNRMVNNIEKRQNRKTKSRSGDRMSELMASINNTQSAIKQMNDTLSKYQHSQQTHHRIMNLFVEQLKGTHLSSAQLDNPFSNPEDPFASFCHSMGMELAKFELIEKDYLQKLNENLVKPIKQFKDSQFNKIYPLQLKYKRLQKKYLKSQYRQQQQPQQLSLSDLNMFNEFNDTKYKLHREILRLKYDSNVNLLNDIDSYWRSFVNLSNTKTNIVSRCLNLRDEDTKDDGNGSEDDDDYKFEIDFNIEQIDSKTGFNDINNDITKYTVKRVTNPNNIKNSKKNKESKKSKKYNRVIYVDSTEKKKIVKLLSLKKNIRCYELSDIEKVEKSYKNIYLLTLKFKDKKEYHYEFETPSKRELFVGEILEYSQYADKEQSLMSIIIGSYNVSESECNLQNIKHWLSPSTVSGQHHDLYIFGLQEVKSKSKKQWMHTILAFIDDNSDQYLCLHSKFLMSIGIFVIIHHSHIAKISHIESQTVATGKGNIIGNKGATAISFQFMETTFLFVNCHLAARAERFEKRAKNFTRIVKELNLGLVHDVDILHQFQHVFWFGDLNYRIEKEFADVIHLIDARKWTEILKFDQLYHSMNFDAVFSGFAEGNISFCPTYRWDKTENIVSNKRNQPPSYTDRILYRTLPNSLSLWQESYTGHPCCFGSDHRPILSVFRFKPRIPYFSYSCRSRKRFGGITISFVELKAQIKNANIGHSKEGNIDILFNFIYSQPTQHKLCDGKYDTKSCYFRWPMIALDDLKIEPFVSDPSFLCTTHISLSFIQKNKILGYAVISLFNAFPKTLINTEKLRNEYMMTNTQMNTMKSAQIVPQPSRKSNKKREEIVNHKGFKIVISKQGAKVGELQGMIFIDGKIIRKHMRYSTMDAHKKAKSPPGSPNSMHRRKRNRQNNRAKVTQSMFDFNFDFAKNKNQTHDHNKYLQSPKANYQ